MQQQMISRSSSINWLNLELGRS